MDEKTPLSVPTHTLSEDVLKDVARCLDIEEPKLIAHLGARLQRYTDRYFAAQKGFNIRLSPGGQRTFLRSLGGRIERLLADLDKAEPIQAVVERYKDCTPSELGGRKPSLEGLRGQLQCLAKITADIVEAPPHKRATKGRPVLDHAVGSFIALFEATTGERSQAEAFHKAAEGDMLIGPDGIALRKVFEAIDPLVTEATLASCVHRLAERFTGRVMRESDFDWISAIEDDGTFDMSPSRL